AYRVLNAPMSQNAKLVYLTLVANGEMNVQQIEIETSKGRYFPQSCVSSAIRRLYDSGYLNVRVEGRFRYYSINHEQVARINRIASQLIGWPEKVTEIKDRSGKIRSIGKRRKLSNV